MKLIGMTATMLALAFASCHKETVTTPATPAPAPVATATPEPAPVVIATPPPAATPAPHLAPEGVFYIVSRVRVETSDGVVGLDPGAGVKRVRDGVYLTPVGEAPLKPEVLTNDLDVARQARDADRAAQAAQASARQALAAPKPTAKPTATTATLAGMPASTAITAADAQRMEISKKMDRISVQMQGIEGQLRALKNANPKTSPTAQALYLQLNALRDQMSKLDLQRGSVR